MSIKSNVSNVDVVNEENNDDAAKTPGDEARLTKKERIKFFLQASWGGIICIVAPLIFLPLLTPFPPQKYQWCAYTLVLMAVFWVTECIPLAITSFLPVLIFPLTGVMDTVTTCRCYMNEIDFESDLEVLRPDNYLIIISAIISVPLYDTIIMFLGSMILAYAVEQSGLHKRLALCAIRAIGYSHARLLFAMSFTTMFVSMWITNTAATTMMVPINFALLKVFEDQNLLTIYDLDSHGERIASDVTTCYFCAATFSATIGGIGTLVGTATNLVFRGLFAKTYPDAPEYLSFPKFSAFAIPYMIIMEIALYLYLLVVYFGFLRPKSKAAAASKLSPEGINAAKQAVEEKWAKLGRITFWEIMVIILFGGAMAMFFSRSPQIFTGWADKIADHFNIKDKKFVQDSAAAMLVAFLMFLLPSHLSIFNNFKAKYYGDLTDKPVPSVLRWTEMNETLAYSFMFLLGGGFALSEAAKKEYSDLNGKIGEMLTAMKTLPNNLILFIIIIFTVFTTNFASNVAVCNVIAPIVMQLAKETNANPLWYNLAAGFSASYCFCLPVGTPGNLVVQGAAKIPTGKMIWAGMGPTITTIFISWLALCFWAPVIWPDLYILPDWAG